MTIYPPPLLHPVRRSSPVLLSVPHAGREYDAKLLANAARGRRSLETLEDPLVDRLAWRAIAAGFGAVIQQVPRAVIDCNRGEEELDPGAIEGIGSQAIGARARAGIGLIPARTRRDGALWRRRIDREELERRIAGVHLPYHRAIEAGLDRLVIDHGSALLLDCHSMPPSSGVADVVIGDRHGTTAAGWVRDQVAFSARDLGFRVAYNAPYAGGAIAARHGRPAESIHAIQLEISRALYLQADGRQPSSGFDRVSRLIERVATDASLALQDMPYAQAAE
ncbi:N-formylglutamate amidohydrolase [Sphingomonas sp. LY29]|uniref:N-formylglutamate amidohydrolase n=1 Tax=Sphingomonas sp. LY29 TaxID=3095341 RepID=UPI002D782D6B|nr:N-formylglutamate amidohydrolase [Sphingomonas sp. LY29]WRP25530.1 N-formylglutamate amidohydrolase [Sphingomonas sp. LY29]